jgi:hypothetical protein
MLFNLQEILVYPVLMDFQDLLVWKGMYTKLKYNLFYLLYL